VSRRDERLAWLGDVSESTRFVAEIVATVDAERALADLRRGAVAGAERLTVADPAAVVEDPLLGARIVVLTTDDGRQIALAEPSTEGRLAATLARRGEGLVGGYWSVPVELDVVRTMAVAANVPLSRPATGPFGRSVLVLGETLVSQLVILVERLAVPSPP
jgi:hypothetical protein